MLVNFGLAIFSLFLSELLAKSEERSTDREELPVENDTGVVMQLWAADIPGKWNLPKTVLPPRRTKPFILGKSDSYYFAVIDNAGDQFSLGWNDVRKMLREDPKLKLSLSKAIQQAQRIRRIWCCECGKY